MSKEQKRLGGIDLFRGLAIYAVIIVHIDEGVEVLPFAWTQIHEFALFAVPFFLATAFYLAIGKLYFSAKPYPLRARIVRLLIPYAIWSVFYLVFKSAKILIAGDSNKVLSLLQDPLSLVFFGGAAYHLYFLPLLATGTVLIKFAEFLIKRKSSLKVLALITLGSWLLYELILLSGNGLDSLNHTTFNPLLSTLFSGTNSNQMLRWIAVENLWICKCLPYVMITMLLTNSIVHERGLKVVSKYSVFWLLIFLGVNSFGALVLPQAMYELARGYVALIAAIASSILLKDSPLIRKLGYCSFGIYLIHLCLVEIFQSIGIRLYPNYIYNINSITLLVVSAIVMLICWGITELLMRQKSLCRILFGFRS